VDETRARSVRWLLAEAGWRRSDPWMTSFVDLDPAHPGGLLGLAPGRSGASVRGWLDLQSEQFRDGIEVVAVDPSAPFAAALRQVLPHATLVVDHWHLHRLGNLMLTQVRQRVTQQVHGHRGRKRNDSWAYRRLLLRGARHLSEQQWRRLQALFAGDDPTSEIQAAWAGKELLRQVLDPLPASRGPLVVDPRRDPDLTSRGAAAGLRPYEIRARLDRFYSLAAEADVPELERLAGTIETWWPAIEAYLDLRITNARTEGYNRKIKQIKRVACGFRNQQSYERRIMLNNAATAA
jgi:transposase